MRTYPVYMLDIHILLWNFAWVKYYSLTLLLPHVNTTSLNWMSHTSFPANTKYLLTYTSFFTSTGYQMVCTVHEPECISNTFVGKFCQAFHLRIIRLHKILMLLCYYCSTTVHVSRATHWRVTGSCSTIGQCLWRVSNSVTCHQ